MQGKEASLCTGCWRLTLLSCVLALHLIPLSVHGKRTGTVHRAPLTMQIHISSSTFLLQQQRVLSVDSR
ncbi:Chondroitin sulfate proteoglycan 5, partial [Nibea albiflora]